MAELYLVKCSSPSPPPCNEVLPRPDLYNMKSLDNIGLSQVNQCTKPTLSELTKTSAHTPHASAQPTLPIHRDTTQQARDRHHANDGRVRYLGVLHRDPGKATATSATRRHHGWQYTAASKPSYRQRTVCLSFSPPLPLALSSPWLSRSLSLALSPSPSPQSQPECPHAARSTCTHSRSKTIKMGYDEGVPVRHGGARWTNTGDRWPPQSVGRTRPSGPNGLGGRCHLDRHPCRAPCWDLWCQTCWRIGG